MITGPNTAVKPSHQEPIPKEPTSSKWDPVNAIRGHQWIHEIEGLHKRIDFLTRDKHFASIHRTPRPQRHGLRGNCCTWANSRASVRSAGDRFSHRSPHNPYQRTRSQWTYNVIVIPLKAMTIIGATEQITGARGDDTSNFSTSEKYLAPYTEAKRIRESRH